MTTYKIVIKTLHLCIAIVCMMSVTGKVNGQQNSTSKCCGSYIIKEQKGRMEGAYILIEVDDLGKIDRNDIVRIIDRQHVVVRSSSQAHRSSFKKYDINNQWKLTPNLLNDSIGPDKHLYVKHFSTDTFQVESKYLEYIDNNTFVTDYSEEKLTALKNHDAVYYIGLESLAPTAEARVIDLNLNPNHINKALDAYPLLDGVGITVSVKEQRFDSTDIDLIGRTVPSVVASETISNHATEMATIIGGKGNSFVTGKGVADLVLFSSSDFSDVLPDESNYYTDNDIGVQNHSYGTEIENFYGVQAAAFDKSTHDHPWLLHIFSSGNQGNDQSDDGIYEGTEGYANLTGNFKMSKNSLVVGAVDTTGQTMAFVSNGPAHDGRIKPEIVAYSAVGSSNSAALVSGTVALLQQSYKDLHGELPGSDLLKALIINTATDVNADHVDYKTGFGNLNAYEAIRSIKNEDYLESSINSNSEVTFEIEIPDNTHRLSVTLVWNDAPAEANSNIALVNDLDLKVVTPDSEVLMPWVLNPDPTLLSNPATRGADHLNNVEKVTISGPSAGTYTISITATNITEDQRFSIAYSVDKKNEFEWLFPTKSDNMPYNGETTGYFRWKSTLDTGVGTLQYSLDNSNSWISIDDKIDLSKGHYRWQPPEHLNTTAKVRMIVDEVYESETFTISRPPVLSLPFNCGDSIALAWNKIDGVSEYMVQELGETDMSAIAYSRDTSIIISEPKSRYYSVIPIKDGRTLIRSQAIDYDLFGSPCFLQSFFVGRNEFNQIVLTANLSSVYGVESVNFYRFEGQNHQFMSSLSPNVVTEFIDPMPSEGINTYFVELSFNNGSTVRSEVSSIFYLSETDFIIFPNPISVNEELAIYSRPYSSEDEISLELLNTSGQIVNKKMLSSDREFLFFDLIKPGLYIYRILINQSQVKAGRLMFTE